MALRPEFRAMLNERAIPVEFVYRLRAAGFIVQHTRGDGRVDIMIRERYAAGRTAYERVTAVRAGIVRHERWGDGIERTVTETPIGDVV